MEKIWLKEYEPGVKSEVNLSKYHSIVDLFKQAVLKFPRTKAFRNAGSSLTYTKAHRLARDLSTYLQHLGLHKGDRIAIMLPNIIPYPVSLFAALQVGLIVVNINPSYSAIQIQRQLTHADVKAIIIFEEFAYKLQEIRYNIPLKHIITVRAGDLRGFIKGKWINFSHRFLSRRIPSYYLPNKLKFLRSISLGRSLPRKSIEIQGDDIAFIQYSSGIPHLPKAAMLSHRNVVVNVLQLFTFIKPSIIHASPKNFVSLLPIYHSLNLIGSLLLSLPAGASNILITADTKINPTVRILRRIKHITLISGLNTSFEKLMGSSQFPAINFKKWIVALAGGARLDESLASRWQEVTGIPINQGYNLLETGTFVSLNPFYHKHYTQSMGVPLPNTSIQVRDFQGKAKQDAGFGELWIKGPQVMRGYWRNPALTQIKLSEDGWFASGDLVRVDENGYLYYVKPTSALQNGQQEAYASIRP